MIASIIVFYYGVRNFKFKKLKLYGSRKRISDLYFMKKKECPSCAMEIDAKSKACPICNYEFAENNYALRWIAFLMALLFLYFIIF